MINGCEFHLLHNLYKMNAIKEDQLAKYDTLDGQYRFEFIREDTQLWFTDSSNKFKCYIDIYNRLTDNLLVRLNCSETDIMNILDCYTQLCDFGMQNIVCPALSPYSANGNYYMIELDLFRIDPIHNIMCDVSSRWFIVKEYNPLSEQLVDIISIEVDMSELEDIMNIMYFIFLIDQEDDKYSLSVLDQQFPREYI